MNLTEIGNENVDKGERPPEYKNVCLKEKNQHVLLQVCKLIFTINVLIVYQTI